MSQVYLPVSANPAVATSYTTNSGTAVPAANVLQIVGGSGVTTSGATNVVTIALNNVLGGYKAIAFADSPYTVLSTDYFISCDSTLGAITVLLPNAPTQYRHIVIKDRLGTSATNSITYTTVGGAVLIDGVATRLLDDGYDSTEILFNGTSYESY